MPAPLQQRPSTPPHAVPVREPVSVNSRFSRNAILGGLESDPWGSPDLHHGHNHDLLGGVNPVLDGYGSVRSTINAWSRDVAEVNESEAPIGNGTNGRVDGSTPSTSWGSGWGDHNDASSDAFGPPGPPSFGGFGSSGGGQGEGGGHYGRSIGAGRTTTPQLTEEVTVTLLPEKEGVFMFQHRNYEVKSARRGSTVIRRYSDFVWLLDCLHKRYPFRQLPLLPPKRVAGTSEAC